MRLNLSIAVLAVTVALASPLPAEGLLMGEPGVRAVPGGHQISFTLAKASDVTVRIVNAKGDVVRHLACGMVGLEKAAAPFAPKTLSQKVLWDGKSNEGKPVKPEGCRAVVLAGMEAKFDKFLLDGHDTFLSDISGFGGSNKTGHVFTANLGCMIHRISFLREFDREGCYVRTVWPLNPNMEKGLLLAFYRRTDTSAWKRYDMKWSWGTKDHDGEWVLGELHDNNLGGLTTAALTQTPDGRIIGMRRIASPRAFIVWAEDGRVINHGQIVAPWYQFGDPLRPHAYDSLNICSGPEGKLLYVTDVGQVAKGGRKRWGWVVGCFDAATLKPVNRFSYSGVKKLDKPVYHLGTPNEPGEDEAHFKAPTGVAIDSKGRFWVADADCLKVYAADGRFLRRIDEKTPGFEEVQFFSVKVGANHKRGGVYVATGGERRSRKDRKLYKIDSLEKLSIVWEVILARPRGHASARQIFVDSEAGIIWVADGAGQRTLLRVVDKGDTFEKKVIDGNTPGKLLKPQWMRTDTDGNIYVLDMGRRAIIKSDIDGKTTSEIPVRVANTDGYFALDEEANIYITESGKPFRLRKFTADGKPLTIGGKESLQFRSESEWARGERDGRIKGVCVTPEGDILVAGALPYHSLAPEFMSSRGRGKGLIASWVNVYDKDGKLKKERLIQMRSINDIQMSRDGLYAVEACVNASTSMRFQAERNETVPHWTFVNKLQKYSLTGGVQDKEGHLWSHPGVGYVNSMACGYECAGAQICVDEDDRVWIPEHVVYNVKAVDSAGNLILRVGSYGNADCDGDPNGKNPKPAVPLAWPAAIARHGDYLLIADRINARIVRCKLEHTDVKTARID